MRVQVEADKKAERIRIIRVEIASLDAASKSLMSKGFSTPDPKRSKTDVISSP